MQQPRQQLQEAGLYTKRSITWHSTSVPDAHEAINLHDADERPKLAELALWRLGPFVAQHLAEEDAEVGLVAKVASASLLVCGIMVTWPCHAGRLVVWPHWAGPTLVIVLHIFC